MHLHTQNYADNCRFGSPILRDFWLGKKKILSPNNNVMRSVGPYINAKYMHRTKFEMCRCKAIQTFILKCIFQSESEVEVARLLRLNVQSSNTLFLDQLCAAARWLFVRQYVCTQISEADAR